MNPLSQRLYLFVLKLHPADFRNQFGREMALDFEQAARTWGLAALWRDVLWSLVRQWSAHILPAPHPASAPTLSLLAGDYIIVCDQTYTLIELGRGLVGSTTLLALCCFGLQTAHRPVLGARASYASGAPTPANNANFETAPTSQNSPAASCAALPRPAADQPHPELLLFHPSGPTLSYEVATVKLIDPHAADAMVKLPPGASLSPLSLRRYIMDAYGAIYPAQVIGGPEWLNKDSYLIRGKVPDDLEARLQTMNSQDRRDQTRTMQQCLLADRFHLQAHFETRVLPVYALVPAKGGLKITAVPAAPQPKPGDPPLPPPHPGSPLPPGTVMDTFNNAGLRVLNGHAINLELLARVIARDAGDRPIVNHTGFNGDFDVTDLTWAPLSAANPTAANPTDAPTDIPSLTRALHTTLGIDVVPAKAPIEVLVIDHIDRPTSN